MRLRSICAVVLGTVMLSDSAFALSCMAPDVIKTLEDAKASEKLYDILVGKFVSQTPPPQITTPQTAPPKNVPTGIGTLPVRPFIRKPPGITQSYFEGFSLALDSRRDEPLTRYLVEVETSCAGDWCSSPPSSNREIIAFVQERDGQPPLLKISPCPYWTFPAETKRVQKVRQCLDKTCESEKPNW